MSVRQPKFDEEFSCDGEWWLPGQEDQQIPGKLRYSASDGIRLECGRRLIPVSAGFRPPPQTVCGKIHPGGPVTLLDAHGSCTGWGPVGSQPIVAGGLVIGASVESWEAPIKGITFWLDGLSKWKSAGPFESGTSSESTGAVLRYQYDVSLEPEPSCFVDALNADVSILSSCGSIGGGHEITLSHDCYLDFQFRDELSLSMAIGIANRVEMLFTLLIGAPTSIQRIELSRNPALDFFQRDIHLLFPRAQRRRSRHYFPRDDMPVTFERIRDFGAVLNSWFAVGAAFSPVLKLLAASLFRSEPEYFENRFLTLAQAIEGYCRIANPNDNYLPRDEFSTLRKAILECIPADGAADFLQVAKSRIGSLNSCSLQDRLKRLFEKHGWLSLLLATPQNPTPSTETIESFVTSVRLARNSLTHVESNPKKRQPIDDLMIWQLRAIICTLLLRESGIDIGKRIAEFVWPQSRVMWWTDYFD
jgi:hypothetical protein